MQLVAAGPGPAVLEDGSGTARAHLQHKRLVRPDAGVLKPGTVRDPGWM